MWNTLGKTLLLLTCPRQPALTASICVCCASAPTFWLNPFAQLYQQFLDAGHWSPCSISVEEIRHLPDQERLQIQEASFQLPPSQLDLDPLQAVREHYPRGHNDETHA